VRPQSLYLAQQTITTSLSRLIALQSHTLSPSARRSDERLHLKTPEGYQTSFGSVKPRLFPVGVASACARVFERAAPGNEPKQVCGKLLSSSHLAPPKLAQMEASQVATHNSVPRCAVCNDAIGVYEPALVIECGSSRATSLAREPALLGGSKLIHRNCAPEAAATGG
jgi:hypothetical protein